MGQPPSPPEDEKAGEPKSRKSGNKSPTRVTVKEVEAVLGRAGLRLEKKEDRKRIYRRAASDGLTDPSKSPRAEVNRLTKSTGLRLPEEDIERVENIAARYGLTRTQWIAKIVMAEVEREEKSVENQLDVDP